MGMNEAFFLYIAILVLLKHLLNYIIVEDERTLNDLDNPKAKRTYEISNVLFAGLLLLSFTLDSARVLLIGAIIVPLFIIYEGVLHLKFLRETRRHLVLFSLVAAEMPLSALIIYYFATP